MLVAAVYVLVQAPRLGHSGAGLVVLAGSVHVLRYWVTFSCGWRNSCATGRCAAMGSSAWRGWLSRGGTGGHRHQ